MTSAIIVKYVLLYKLIFMSKLLWAKVYYQDKFAGYLQQEPGQRYVFTYDQSYLTSSSPAIAYTLPLQKTPHISEQALHPFFDNLVAEGWLETAQRRLLGKRTASRFELLLAFGNDCAGAVSIIDPEPAQLHTDKIEKSDQANLAIMQNRASLSGIQPKLLLIKEKQKFRLAQLGEISTHIAKLPSLNISDIVYNEWLTLHACQALLPNDDFVVADLTELPGICEQALIIKRFDRAEDSQKIHFEEFNQLLNLDTIEKYDGAYKDMADFIYQNKLCLRSDVYRLFKRILAGLLTGNTDMHFKNFAMFNNEQGLRLTPNYDQVSAAIYKPYQYVALRIDNVADRIIKQLKAKNIIALGQEFGLNDEVIMMAISEIQNRLGAAKQAVVDANQHHTLMRDNIINFMEKRWQETFSSIGQLLSKKR